MKTEVLPIHAESLAKAAALIRAGEVVAFPTETVYGLGADALNVDAVRKIYAAKGRPSDNPLIVHLDTPEKMPLLAREIPAKARALAEAFMPGPLTVVLPKQRTVPDCVTGGIDTVGIRVPEHPGARAFLQACGCPIAAPSANSSGKPSPTSAAHVLEDLDGKIPLILDGGECSGGVESTVISLAAAPPLLLRPGLVTYEQLCAVLGEVRIHPAVLENNRVDKAASPGMKYKHYAPLARVMVVQGTAEDACAVFDAAAAMGRRPLLLWRQEDALGGRDSRVFFSHNDSREAARNLFSLLRQADEEGYDTVFVEAVPQAGAGLSVMNRLLRSSAFTVLRQEQIRENAAETVLANLA